MYWLIFLKQSASTTTRLNVKRHLGSWSRCKISSIPFPAAAVTLLGPLQLFYPCPFCPSSSSIQPLIWNNRYIMYAIVDSIYFRTSWEEPHNIEARKFILFNQNQQLLEKISSGFFRFKYTAEAHWWHCIVFPRANDENFIHFIWSDYVQQLLVVTWERRKVVLLFRNCGSRIFFR